MRRFYVAVNVTYKKQKRDRGRITEQPKGALRDELFAQEYREGDFCSSFFFIIIFLLKEGFKKCPTSRLCNACFFYDELLPEE